MLKLAVTSDWFFMVISFVRDLPKCGVYRITYQQSLEVQLRSVQLEEGVLADARHLEHSDGLILNVQNDCCHNYLRQVRTETNMHLDLGLGTDLAAVYDSLLQPIGREFELGALEVKLNRVIIQILQREGLCVGRRNRSEAEVQVVGNVGKQGLVHSPLDRFGAQHFI
jgi:hypothetical protein